MRENLGFPISSQVPLTTQPPFRAPAKKHFAQGGTAGKLIRFRSDHSNGRGERVFAWNNLGFLTAVHFFARLAPSFGMVYRRVMITKLSLCFRAARNSFGGMISALMVLLAPGTQAKNLFVSVDQSDTGPYSWSVVKIQPDGTQSVFASGLRPVYWLAANGAGALFGANADNNTVSITPGGVQIFASGVAGPLTFDTAGNLFVSANGNIYKYTPGGIQSTFAAGISGPLTFDNVGNLFVEDNDNIYKFTPGGLETTFIAGLGLTHPVLGLAVDSADNLFVSQQQLGGYIYKYTPDGTKTTFGPPLGGPCGLAFDSAGNLFAADNLGLKIDDFSQTGTLVTVFPIQGGVWYPTALAFQPVPEPSLWGLITIGAAVLFVRRPVAV
jgi:hypothetical protein